MSPGGLLPNTTSIRLLTVEAGSGSDAIVTRLCVVDLDQAHADYEAISYTWGAPQAEHTITVDGKPVNIRINLQQALLRLRHSTQPRTLWCDYLCITQTDHVEKAQQVQMIGRIFGTATTVHVWLGEHADHSEELFRDWYHPPESEGVLQDLKRRLKSDDPAALAHKQAAAHRAQTWANLFQRPYWRRTWIIQGLRLARAITIHIGPDSLPWKDLISARFTPLGMHGPFDHLSLSPYLDSTSFDDPQFLLYASLSWISKFVAVPMKPLRKAPGHVIMDDWEKGPNDIFDIVGRFRDTFCHDPRDKVFAVHTLEQKRKETNPLPWTTTSVFRTWSSTSTQIDTSIPNPPNISQHASLTPNLCRTHQAW